MNPFLNPITLAKVIKYYLTDIDRLWKYNEEKLEDYRQKCFRKVLKLAMKTPLYKEKYKGIDVNKITLDNIEKLPILTKQDLRKHFPNGIVPEGFDVKKAHIVSTSGSTGQPVSVYTDFHTIVKALMGFIREIREYDISWRKDRMTIIADLTPGSAEEAYLNQTAIPNLKSIFSLNNMQILHVGEDVEKLIEKINSFNPKFIGGYPGVLRALAVLKRKGYGKNIEPEVIASSGAVLDEYTKKYIEEAFNARVFDVYGSTEGGPIAFECKKGNYHIHYDMVHVEFLDDNLQPVEYGKPGHIVVTKLYGSATPIIRYNGLNDFVIPLAKKCTCGINAPLIEKIGGRKADSIVLPSGKIIPPSSITGIPAKVMEKMDTKKILQFQILQKTIDKVEVLIVIDEELRSIGPSVEEIFRELKKKFEERFDGEVEVEIKEVKKIEKPANLDTPPPVVTSMVRVG
jgi:phenylacetate-CoA ligase